MLRGLNIRNMLLIDALELEFQSGLNVLTGETGAGKSILLDSLGFVLGWRGRADMVRKGADLAEVEAWFEVAENHPANEVLRAAGIPVDDEILLRRTNTPDGRKTSYVNNRRCTGDVLRGLSACLLELHGQHDDRGFLNPKGHLDLLDQMAGIDRSDIRRSWAKVATLKKDIDTLTKELEKAKDDEDFIRHSLKEFNELSPVEGEDERLDKSRRLMQAGTRIRESITKAGDVLSDQGAEGSMMDATRWLQDVADQAEGRLDGALEALSRATDELAEAQNGVRDCLSALEFNPAELEQVEERLFAIRALARKHDVQPDALAQKLVDMQAKLAALDTGTDRLDALQQDLERAQQSYLKKAEALSRKRMKAAQVLDTKMAAELPPLKMEAATFKTQVTPCDPGRDGIDLVAFEVSTNPGAALGSIIKIASGGELSRFLLALKVCLTAQAEDITLIFDEIDRGVGGATADAVGKRLLTIASEGQVLVVTHSPQVAACGDHHWMVSKSSKGNETLSTVAKLDSQERELEIARMLAGDQVTDAARGAARALMGKG